MKFYLFLITLLIVFSCKNPTESKLAETSTSDTISVEDFRDFKVLDSKYITRAEIWETINSQMDDFLEADYNRLKPLILEQDIPTLQRNIEEKKFNYEQLTKFYLFRIRKFDRENPLSLNSVISIHPNVIAQAKKADNADRSLKSHPIFGMPILLKDNINASGIATTAGAVALQNNLTEDAFITRRLKEHGAIILGKANLSEWAYFFCGDCPSGYSAIGGQTLNPYGRRIIDTGGSSSGSGVAVATNFCVGAVGSETSGSILSPSSKNSIVGLKPTIGLLSRGGIVPISSTLDTPGPMTKNVTDNAILLDALFGFDEKDFKSINSKLGHGFYYNNSTKNSLVGMRFGAFKRLLEDSLYVQALSDLKSKGAEIIEIDEEDIKLSNFRRLLNLDMKADLPVYFSKYASAEINLNSVQDVIDFNKKDSISIMPYGQRLFEGVVADEASEEAFQTIKDSLKINGRNYFDIPMIKHQLDGVLSINNYHAGFAAVAEYPAMTVPMGYTTEGVPEGLTFISNPLSEKQLLEWAYTYEQASKKRKAPEYYN